MKPWRFRTLWKVKNYPSQLFILQICVNAALCLTYNSAKQRSLHAMFSHCLLLEARGVKF